MEISPTIRYLGVVEHFIYTPFLHFVIIGFWGTVFVVQSKRMGPLMATNMMTPGCTMMVWYRMPMVWTKNHDQYSRKGSWMTDLVWYPSLHAWNARNIYQHLPTNHPNVDRYTIHGAYGIWFHQKMGMPRYPNNHPKEESPRGHAVVSVQLVGTCPWKAPPNQWLYPPVFKRWTGKCSIYSGFSLYDFHSYIHL